MICEDLLEGNVNKNKVSSASEVGTSVNQQFDSDGFKTNKLLNDFSVVMAW